MNIKYIHEGFFKNAAQIAKQREKEAAMSDEDIVASVTKKTVENKIRNIINSIIAEKKINPFPITTIFYDCPPENGISALKVTKRETSVEMKNIDGKLTILVDFNLGSLRLGNSRKIVDEVWLALYYNNAHLDVLDKSKMNKTFSKRIKNVIGKSYPLHPENKTIYDLICNSDIQVNKISMFDGNEKLTFRTLMYDAKDFGLDDYEKFFNVLTETITFDTDIDIVIDHTRMVSKDDVPELNQFDTLTDLENAAKIGDALEKYAQEQATKQGSITPRAGKLIYNKFKTFTHFFIAYNKYYMYKLVGNSCSNILKTIVHVSHFEANDNTGTGTVVNDAIRLYFNNGNQQIPGIPYQSNRSGYYHIIVALRKYTDAGKYHPYNYPVNSTDDIYRPLEKFQNFLEKLLN